MDEINWIQIILGFLGGGAVGALIKQFFDSRKHRIQSIGKNFEIKPFYNSVENKLLSSQIILSDAVKEYKFSKLYMGSFKIANTGHHDYPSFTFGITCPDNVQFIHIKPSIKDRHHVPEILDMRLHWIIKSANLTLL